MKLRSPRSCQVLLRLPALLTAALLGGAFLVVLARAGWSHAHPHRRHYRPYTIHYVHVECEPGSDRGRGSVVCAGSPVPMPGAERAEVAKRVAERFGESVPPRGQLRKRVRELLEERRSRSGRDRPAPDSDAENQIRPGRLKE